MNNTSSEKKQHSEKMDAILNQMRDEQMVWFGRTDGVGKHVALGEYILELASSEHPDSWLTDAGNAFLEWKKTRDIQLTPPL